ncbi:MAG TPA: VanW family protein [Frankiaceae bacterium]|nr:VanW family protein [Frankiaceae bacterium]
MTRATRGLLIGLLALVGLLSLVYVADIAMASGRVPRGTEVAGVKIGGKSRAEAVRLIAAGVTVPGTLTVTVPGGAETLTLAAADIGLHVDAERTVDEARGEALNPFRRLASAFATNTVEPAVVVDDAKLRAKVAEWAKKVDHGKREGSVRFDGVTPVAVPPRAGRRLDVEATANRVVDSFPGKTATEAIVVTDPVRTTAQDVQNALDNIAKPAVGAPVTLTAPGKGVTMTRAQIASVLRIDTDPDGRITPKLDAKRLDTILTSTLKAVEAEPKDARFSVDDKGAITIAPSVNGTKVDRKALADALLPALTQPSPRIVTLTIVQAQPRITTELARTLGIKEKVSEFTTNHPCCRPRVRNIHIMADIVEGAVVLPGETFSLNGFVGARDRKRGFVEAPMILDGKFVPAVGGGVSQFATTLFNAVFFAGLEDVEHKPHSYFISRYPPGREATVSTPHPDLKFRNDSPNGILITTSYTEKSITVTFWGTKRYDVESISSERYRFRSFGTQYDYSPTCESTSGVSGFDIDVWRVFKQGGKEVRPRQKFHTRYLPEPRFVCRRR